MDNINFSNHNALLKCLLFSDDFKENYQDFLPLNEDELNKAVLLNKYELEGSLIGMLANGTCMESIVSDENEARVIVSKLFKELRLDYDSLIAYRLNNTAWSPFTNGTTMSSFYVLFQSSHRYWMVIGFTDFY